MNRSPRSFPPLWWLSLLFILFIVRKASSIFLVAPAVHTSPTGPPNGLDISCHHNLSLVQNSTATALLIGPPAVHKRRVPIQPSAAKKPPEIPADEIRYIRIYSFEYVWTDAQVWPIIIRFVYDTLALFLMGMDIEDRQFIGLRLGAYTLNLWVLEQTLTQDIVLSVLRRVVQMFKSRMGWVLGEGVVNVGAGVRVLFAAGVRLEGLEVLRDGVAEAFGLFG